MGAVDSRRDRFLAFLPIDVRKHALQRAICPGVSDSAAKTDVVVHRDRSAALRAVSPCQIIGALREIRGSA